MLIGCPFANLTLETRPTWTCDTFEQDLSRPHNSSTTFFLLSPYFKKQPSLPTGSDIDDTFYRPIPHRQWLLYHLARDKTRTNRETRDHTHHGKSGFEQSPPRQTYTVAGVAAVKMGFDWVGMGVFLHSCHDVVSCRYRRVIEGRDGDRRNRMDLLRV